MHRRTKGGGFAFHLLLSDAISRPSGEGDIGEGVTLLAVGGKEPLGVELVWLREGLLVAVQGKTGQDNVGVGRDDVAINFDLLA